MTPDEWKHFIHLFLWYQWIRINYLFWLIHARWIQVIIQRNENFLKLIFMIHDKCSQTWVEFFFKWWVINKKFTKMFHTSSSDSCRNSTIQLSTETKQWYICTINHWITDNATGRMKSAEQMWWRDRFSSQTSRNFAVNDL